MSHGFVVLDVTPERVQADYHHTVPTSARPDPRTEPATLPTYARSFQTLAGSRAVTPGLAPIGGRSDRPRRPGGHQPIHQLGNKPRIVALAFQAR